METVIVVQTANGFPVHFDRFASEADHVFVVGRVKPHTRFVGPVESGPPQDDVDWSWSMSSPKIYHRGILTMNFPEIISAVAEQVLNVCRVCGGLAILENAEDETALLEAVRPENFKSREPELLKLANTWLPRSPFPEVDLLIVDRIGKNISGVGMDANVVGRKFNDHAATEFDAAKCRRILVRSLTKETYGNATGIGMAEFTTKRCVDQIDHETTRINCVTGNHPEAAMIPITLPNDASAVDSALQTIGMIEPENAKVIQISDTLHLTRLRVSEAYFEAVCASEHLSFDGEPFDFPVSPDGWMSDISH